MLDINYFSCMSGHHEFMKFHVKLCRWEIRTKKSFVLLLTATQTYHNVVEAESFLMTCATKRKRWKMRKNLSEFLEQSTQSSFVEGMTPEVSFSIDCFSKWLSRFQFSFSWSERLEGVYMEGDYTPSSFNF